MASWNVSQAQVEVDPDPRPEKRHKASQGETAALKAHFAGACCVHCGLPYQHRHHIAFRKADSGDDIAVNIAPMCLSCHDKFHSRAPGWERIAASIRVYVLGDRDRGVYAVKKLGWDKLNSRYPMLSEPGGADGETRTQMSSGRPGSESDWDKYEEPVWRYRSPEDEPDRFEEELSW